MEIEWCKSIREEFCGKRAKMNSQNTNQTANRNENKLTAFFRQKRNKLNMTNEMATLTERFTVNNVKPIFVINLDIKHTVKFNLQRTNHTIRLEGSVSGAGL